MDVDRKCNISWPSACYEEASGPHAVIIIPSLLGLSTVMVVTLILACLLKHKRRQRRSTAHFASGQQSLTQTATSSSSPKVQTALCPWEIPATSVLEGLEFWQTGRYGPICKGLLRDKDGVSLAVVVKSLREGPNQPEAKEFLDWLLFHATVCKHENVVRMLFCQTQCVPMYLVLDACHPGNLLHFLWSLRNVKTNATSSGADPLQNFSERSVILVAKQVAAGLDYLMSAHRLVHGDVAARNILIGPGLAARVSGLGAAFGGCRAAAAVLEEVPLKWQAPERMMMQLSIDRSDVWSFGILLYELITLGSPPYPELEPPSVLQKLRASYRMKRPEHCGGPLYDLMKYCWMWSFKERPAFSGVVKLLESSLRLSASEPICVAEVVDIFDYNRRAGLVSYGQVS